MKNRTVPLLNRLRQIIICVCLGTAASLTCPAIGFDNTFGSGGRFMTTFSAVGDPSSGGTQVFLQPSGRIVSIGSHTQQGTGRRFVGIGLLGLTSGGTLDTTYGVSGKTLLWDGTFDRFPTNAEMLADGSLLVLYQRWETVSVNKPVLAKFNASGQLDTSFNPDLDLFPGVTYPARLALSAGGKILVAVRNGHQFYLIRLTASGERDSTFGPNGVRYLNLNRFADRPEINGLHELASGKVLVTGLYTDREFYNQTFVARFDSDTNIDRTFGLQGAVRLSIPGGGAYSVVTIVQPDGKILIGGSWVFLGSNTMLYRLTSRGRLDPDFGTRGLVMTSFNNTNMIRGIAVAPDGRIIVAGSSGAKAIPSNTRLFLITYSATGTQQSHLVTNFVGDLEAGASDVRLQADGKILLTGFTDNPMNNFTQIGVARFLP